MMKLHKMPKSMTGLKFNLTASAPGTGFFKVFSCSSGRLPQYIAHLDVEQ